MNPPAKQYGFVLVLNGGLSGTNLTLYGSIKNPRTFEIYKLIGQL